MKLLRISFLLGSLAFVPGHLFGQITSNFNTNADGWTAPAAFGGTLTYNAAGGNPGGYVSGSDPASAALVWWYYIAPAKFLGNRCPSYNKNLTFDLSQTTAGTDTTQPDVVLVGGGVTLTYKITPSPTIVPTWKSYSILLNETSGWKTIAGVAPTKDEFKSVLCNLTSLSIRGKFNSSVSSGSRLDNVIMGELTVGTRPVITSIAPTTGPTGTTVTIAGSNFNSTLLNNVVYFGNVRATVQAASPTQVTVAVPTGATFGRITLTNTGTNLEAQSSQNFDPTFDNNLDYGGRIIACSMDLKFDITLDANVQRGYANAADLDGDGLTDLLAVETNAQKFSIFRNLGLMGDINAGSFAAKVSFALGAGYSTKGANVIADFDGDGKPDVAVGSATTSNAFIALFRNSSTPGNITFDPVQYVMASSYSDGSLHAADIDGDGRMELLSAFNNSCGGAGAYFSIFQNMSQPGDIEFCAFVDFDFGVMCQANNISTGDLNSDGKLDIIVTSNFDNYFYVFQNNSTPGTVSVLTPFQIDSPGTAYSVAIADLDVDGKLDLAWKSDSPNEIYVKKNNHTAGALSAASFSADIVLQTPLGSSGQLTVADINGDGRPDIVANDDNNLGIIENLSKPGTLTAASFASGVIYEGHVFASVPTNPVIADFDRDSKPDVAFGTTNVLPAYISIYRNECFPAPAITSLSSLTGIPGTPLTIAGSLMFTANQTPSLQFGAVSGLPGTASNTTVTTSTPLGAGYGRVGVTLHGLSAFSSLPFSTLFPTSPITTTTFATSVDFPMTSNSRSMAVADFDKDGKIDVIAEDNAVLKIFRNTLSAPGAAIDNTTYTALATTYTSYSSVTGGDIDGDGLIDLITNGIINRNNSGTQADPISFQGNVTSVAGGGNRYSTNHDYNHDGKMDVAFTDNGNLVRVTENTSRKGPFTYFPFSTFQPLVNITPGGQVIGIDGGDFDGDGSDDLVYGISSGTTVNFHLNTGLQGTITAAQFAVAFPVTVGSAPYEVVAVDLDQDGKLDLAVSNFSSTFVTVLRNTSTPGNLSFVRQDVPSLSFGFTLRAADLNGDGKPELVTIHQLTATTGSFTVFPNTSSSGTISFGARIDYTLPNKPEGLAVADVNLDKKPDIIIPRNGDFLSVFQNNLVIATINILKQPADISVCAGATATFNTDANGTTNITYQWQFAPTSAGPFVNITDGGGYSGATTSTLSVNTTGNFGVGRYRCSIGGDFAISVLTTDEGLTLDTGPACSSNQPPVIAPATENAVIGGTVKLNLTSLLSDPDGNLDLSTLAVTIQPSSGAIASIDANHVLTVNYSGLAFAGIDVLTIQVCDLLAACVTKQIQIEVGSDVVVYNAVSVNGDNKNEKFILEFIDVLAATQKNRVTIYNRWGDEVFDVSDYNNTSRVFTGISSDGKPLPSGTYFYKIVFGSGAKTLSGYLELKR